jgi:1-phosphofructokinase
MTDAPPKKPDDASPHGGVCVFAPSTIVTVTVEGGDHHDEVHFHAGGQGFWIARLLARLGVPTTLCTVFGGESGRVARALVEAEQIHVRAVGSDAANGAWVHDRRSGERRQVAELPGEPLSRHVIDELFGATLTTALDAGICVLAGPQRRKSIDAEIYHRLAADLRANGVEVIADLSGDELIAALAGGVDFCKVSDEDLFRTEGFVDETDPVRALHALREAGAAHAAITRGADPLLALLGDDPVEVRAPALHVVDHRGAGDAFTALVAATQYWGLEWSDGLRWGASAGALTVVRRGLATADRREIHRLLSRIEVNPLPS